MTPSPFQVPLDDGRAVTALHYPASEPAPGATLVVAHGAGAGQHSAFIVSFADALATAGFDAVTFNFPYTEQGRRLPDRAPVLEACYAAVIHQTRQRIPSAARWLFIGGKSMGGRIATHVAAADAQLPVAGLVLLGYPLHPPGRPGKRRDAHLPSIRRPLLVVQGSRDAFGTADEIRPVFESLTPPATVHIVEGGDHSFRIPRSGSVQQGDVDLTVRHSAAEWMRTVMRNGEARRPQPV